MNGKEDIWLGLCAFFGVMARSARWTTPQGSIDWKKALFETLTAPAIGIVAAALGSYEGVNPTIMGGIAALLGLLGPATIEAVALKWFQQKIGVS